MFEGYPTGAPKQTAKGVTQVAPFVFAVSAKTCRIGNVCFWALCRPIQVNPLSLEAMTRHCLIKFVSEMENERVMASDSGDYGTAGAGARL